MDIKIDENYQLTSDPYNYILQERKEVLDGDNKGQAYFKVIGYYSTLISALKAYKELQIRTSKVTTVDELFNLIKKLDEKTEKLLGGN